MTTTSLRPTLDAKALYRALDAERIARGMTWKEVAHEVHYSVPSIKGMTTRTQIEADAVVLILQWLRRRCDDFVVGPRCAADHLTGRTVVLPPVPERFARFDTIALHGALDRARQRRGLAWADVADALGVSPGVIARFTKGGRTNADLMIAGADWAGEPVEGLMQPSQPVLGYARMDAKASKPKSG